MIKEHSKALINSLGLCVKTFDDLSQLDAEPIGFEIKKAAYQDVNGHLRAILMTPSEIKITRLEGPSAFVNKPETYECYIKTTIRLREWAKHVHPGSYDKCNIEILWPDGTKYATRYDLKHTFQSNFYEEIYENLLFLTGQKMPYNMSDSGYEAFLRIHVKPENSKRYKNLIQNYSFMQLQETIDNSDRIYFVTKTYMQNTYINNSINQVLYNCCTGNSEPDWTLFDALELNGCITIKDASGDDDFTEGGIKANEAEFFTIYGHLKTGGVDAITDIHDFQKSINIFSHLKLKTELKGDILC